jgi:hypothetical protein
LFNDEGERTLTQGSASFSKPGIPTNILGRHVLAYSLALHFFFGSIYVLNALNLTFFYYYPRPIRIAVIDPYVDLLVWSASVLCASAIMLVRLPKSNERKIVQAGLALLSATLSVALVATTTGAFPSRVGVYSLFLIASATLAVSVLLNDQILGRPSRSLIVLVAVYLLASVAAVEVSSAIHYSAQAFDFTTAIGKSDAGIELQLSYASYGLLPWLYVAFLFSWAWVPLVQRLVPRTPLTARKPAINVTNKTNRSSLFKRILDNLDTNFFLTLALAVFIGYYPYFQNPPWIVGTDAYWRYFDPLSRMVAKNGVFAGFRQVLHEREIVPLMILYGARLVLPMSLTDIVRAAQLLLVLALALATTLFLAYDRNSGFGLTVFLLSVLSLTTTIGFYASILANWTALVIWLLFFAFLSFKSQGNLRVSDFAVLLLLSTLLLFTHPATWGVFAATVIATSVLVLIQERRKGFRSAGFLIGLVVIDLVLALVVILGLLAKSQGGDSVAIDAVSYYTFVFSNPSSVFWFWGALTHLTQVWSPFFSPLYLAISIAGVFSVSSLTANVWRKRLVFAWLFVSALGSILVAPVGFTPTSPAGSDTELWRLLYITPFPVLVPFGIVGLINFVKERSANNHSPQESNGLAQWIWLGILFLIGIALAWGGLSSWERVLFLVGILPLVTAILLIRSNVEEDMFLSSIILGVFLLVAFNNTTRALSQVLIDPHNYRPRS